MVPVTLPSKSRKERGHFFILAVNREVVSEDATGAFGQHISRPVVGQSESPDS